MALTGSERAYLQARSGIARSAAIRSNYVWPLVAFVTVGGVDLTAAIQYGSLHVTQQLNEQPDTASFSVMVTSRAIQDALQVGADVLIGLGGPSENALFGGRILTKQTTRGPARTPSVLSVMCADYLQVLDSEWLITFNYPAQSTTTTILDLVRRFANKPGGVAISTAAVQTGLPNHTAFAIVNERWSTVLRRLVTMFPAGGGFYVDPLKKLHVWAGLSEPNVSNPQPLTIDAATLKAFADTVDGSQLRDAVLVEGMRTTAPMGSPAVPSPPGAEVIFDSLPVLDASIFDAVTDTGADREVRIGSQRMRFRYAEGIWSSPVGTATSTKTTVAIAFDPNPAIAGNTVTIPLASMNFLTNRNFAWVRIDEQYLRVTAKSAGDIWIVVPRTGYGAMTGPIDAGATVTAIDSLGSLRSTGRYQLDASTWEGLRAQPIESEAVMTVRSATGAGLREHLVQDGRYSRAGATARGLQEVADFVLPLTSIEFETDDLNAKPGRLQAYSFDAGHPDLAPTTGEYMILTSEMSWPVWGQPPRIHCTAARVRAANVVDAWLVDTR